jgi:predicted NBD/HSP70 family sugar kinase
MIAAGIDLGGSKSEVQLYDSDWCLVASKRVVTPRDYDGLVVAVADQVRWARDNAGPDLPVGIGAAGLVDGSGQTVTANLPATGRAFPADIADRAGGRVTYLNDCRALALSEAVFGAARGQERVMSLILGTGVGGGLAVEGRLPREVSGTGGEYGHVAAPAHLVAAHDLPLVTCGCGRTGCIETLIAGPGLERIGAQRLGRRITTHEIAAKKDTDEDVRELWRLWCALTANLMLTMVHMTDPDCIVLAGGLSRIPNVAGDLESSLSKLQFRNFSVPAVLLAEGGDASGGRGAAYAAWLAAGNDPGSRAGNRRTDDD